MSSSDCIQTGANPFFCLPQELLDQILFELPNSDIKSLRLACTHLCRVAKLRLSRLFLSPNPLNVSVFRAVADHEEFRKKIVEIIYDDARLGSSDEVNAWCVDDDYDTDVGDVDGVPPWFLHIYHKNYKEIHYYGWYDVKRPDHAEVQKRFKAPVNPAQSYKLYRKLVQEQDQVIAANSDVDALRYGLLRFPNLQRITLTPVAHGDPVRRFYQTPMVRSLPGGLIYPIPRGWPVTERQFNGPVAESWDGEEKRKWRGLCLITHAVAQHQRENPTAGISEFIIDSNQLNTGISCRVFDDAENSEYKDLVAMLARPGFSRIDLSLYVCGQDDEDWHSLRSGNLQYALSMAHDLRHVSLSINFAVLDKVRNSPSGGEEHHVPLRTIFAIDMWPNLQHFCLSHFLVKQADLTDFLRALPPTLQSVELSFLSFIPRNGDCHYESFLRDMRGKLDWRERAAAGRPKIIICVDGRGTFQRTVICVNREVEEFVYGEGENPFSESTIFRGTGTWVGGFHPEFERPYISGSLLVER